jgi:hypothetical protein
MGDLAGGWQNLVLGQAKNDSYHQADRVWCRRGAAPGGVGSITLLCTVLETAVQYDSHCFVRSNYGSVACALHFF